MKVAILGAAHQHVDYALAEVAHRDELEEVRRAAAQACRHVSLVFEKRFHPATLALRRLLANGVLGEIAMIASTGPHKLNQSTRPAWFLDPAAYGGIAGDLPVHDIDLVLDLVAQQTTEAGEVPSRLHGTVSALAGNARAQDHPGFDDHVSLLLRAGDVPATLEANWLGPEAGDVHGHYRMRITGAQGTAEVDWAYHRLTVTTHDRPTWEEPLGFARRPAQYFFDALLEGREPEVTTLASLQATEVALLAQCSAESGGAVQSF